MHDWRSDSQRARLGFDLTRIEKLQEHLRDLAEDAQKLRAAIVEFINGALNDTARGQPLQRRRS
jgi:hypothetical protein